MGDQAHQAKDHAEISIESAEQDATVELRADGTTLWVRPKGDAGVELPAGKTWVEGDASRLEQSDSFAQEDLIGVILALRGATGTEVGDSRDIDGTATQSYTTTIAYDDAVTAAGDQAAAFESALSLTADEAPLLNIEVSIGDDGIIRRFQLEVDAQSGAPLGGTYEVDLTDVNAEVEPPEAPAAADVVSGPEAEALLDQLIN